MLILSINVFEKPDFLKKQLENIENFVKDDYRIILNCNDYMYDVFKKENINKVIINPEVINKNRFHGSLTQGIYSNIKYALENQLMFSYFIILSSRTFFYNELSESNFLNENRNIGQDKNSVNYHTWHWPSFTNTLLFSRFKNYKRIAYSLHEGLVFSYNVCKNIVHCLENFSDIKNNLFNFNSCVEEFALHTISVNYTNIFENNHEIGYHTILHPEGDIGNYTAEQASNFPKNKYVYRTHR